MSEHVAIELPPAEAIAVGWFALGFAHGSAWTRKEPVEPVDFTMMGDHAAELGAYYAAHDKALARRFAATAEALYAYAAAASDENDA